MRRSTYWMLLALVGGPRHGYALMEEVARLSDGREVLKVATLYPALERMVSDGLIAVAGEEVVAGRRRRYVRLTDDGAAALEEEAARQAAEADRTRARLREHGWGNGAGAGEPA